MLQQLKFIIAILFIIFSLSLLIPSLPILFIVNHLVIEDVVIVNDVAEINILFI